MPADWTIPCPPLAIGRPFMRSRPNRRSRAPAAAIIRHQRSSPAPIHAITIQATAKLATTATITRPSRLLESHKQCSSIHPLRNIQHSNAFLPTRLLPKPWHAYRDGAFGWWPMECTAIQNGCGFGSRKTPTVPVNPVLRGRQNFPDASRIKTEM